MIKSKIYEVAREQLPVYKKSYEHDTTGFLFYLSGFYGDELTIAEACSVVRILDASIIRAIDKKWYGKSDYDWR